MGTHFRCLAFLVALIAGAAPVAAQSPAEHATLERGFTLLTSPTDTGDTRNAQQALDLFGRLVWSEPSWAEAWYGLGLSRASLAWSDVIAKEGPLQPLGAGFGTGAAHALVRALELDPSLLPAAVALADHPGLAGWDVDAPGAATRERLAMLRRLSPPDTAPQALWLGRARLEAEAGDLDSAASYLMRYLAAGGDTGVGRYHQARVRYRLGDRAGAVRAYYAGAAGAASAEAARLYRSNIAWVADSAELAAFDSLPAGALEAWLRDFWGRRDAETARTEHERLLEHFRRYEYVLANFRITPSLQRQRAGVASATAGTPAGAAPEPVGTQRASAAPSAAPSGLGGADFQTTAMLAGASSAFSHYVSHQQTVDHRGVIYMRHGAPDRRAIDPISGSESWSYEAGGERLLVHFVVPAYADDHDGSAGPTRLTPIPPLGRLEALCGIDSELCLLGMRLRTSTSGPGARLPTIQLQRAAERGAAAIRRGLTTDTYAPRYAEPLEPVVQLYALHGGAGAADGRLLAVFAVRGEQLAAEPAADAAGRARYALSMRLVAYAAGGARRELDTVRTFVTPAPLEDDEYLSGTLELPLAPGTWSARLTIRQEPADEAARRREPGKRPVIEAERGALVGLDGLRVPRRGGGLALSDIVLGREGTGLSWWSGRERIALNPLNAVPRRGVVQLYYELSGLAPGAEYRTRLAVYRRGDEERRALLTLAFTDAAPAEWQAVRRELDIGRLSEGSYDLEVQVEPLAGGPARARQVVLNVR